MTLAKRVDGDEDGEGKEELQCLDLREEGSAKGHGIAGGGEGGDIGGSHGRAIGRGTLLGWRNDTRLMREL